MYARHGREPFGPESLDLELETERLKAEGLMVCPFDPAQREGSPLYVNPVNVLNILTKVLAEGKGVSMSERKGTTVNNKIIHVSS